MKVHDIYEFSATNEKTHYYKYSCTPPANKNTWVPVRAWTTVLLFMCILIPTETKNQTPPDRNMSPMSKQPTIYEETKQQTAAKVNAYSPSTWVNVFMGFVT